MAGIAEVLLSQGYAVSGSDIKSNSLSERLQSLGANVFVGHSAEQVSETCGCLVYSSAIASDNPELIRAKERGIPCISRGEMLAELMRMKYGVAIAGSHGKTTTTSMTAHILRLAELDPTIIVGGRLLSSPSGAQVGAGDFLIAEADESDGSFTMLRPAVSVVTNIDKEHLSHYGDEEELERAFIGFLSAVPFYGVGIVCAEDPILLRASKTLSRRCLTYGFSDSCDFSAVDVEFHGASSSYTLCRLGERLCRVSLPMPGRHMVSNSLAALAVASELGVNLSSAAEALATFPGVARRMELISDKDGVLVIDDYAHHPTEIAATLRALSGGYLSKQAKDLGLSKPGRLIVLFEPHRYSRTLELWDEFRDCFEDASLVYIGEMYAAGEKAIENISSESLAKHIDHPAVFYTPDFSETLRELTSVLQAGDVVVTLGAGAVGRYATLLRDSLLSESVDEKIEVNRIDSDRVSSSASQ
jgi:UDP-N-acetylmuramate--alanine ligase